METVFTIARWLFVGIAVICLMIYITSPRDPKIAAQVAVAEAKTEAEQQVRKMMRDPASAQFGETVLRGTISDNNWVVCGTVNGRNMFGGMTGPQAFVYLSVGRIVMINDAAAVRTHC